MQLWRIILNNIRNYCIIRDFFVFSILVSKHTISPDFYSCLGKKENRWRKEAIDSNYRL